MKSSIREIARERERESTKVHTYYDIRRKDREQRRERVEGCKGNHRGRHGGECGSLREQQKYQQEILYLEVMNDGEKREC